MDFVLQVNLAEAPALPQFLSDTRLWVFIGDDEGRYGVEHALIVHPPETGLVCTPRPDGPRMERSLDYRPLPARWVPSLAIKSEGRYFGPGKVAEYELQEAIDRAALDLAGLDSSGFGAGSSLSRLGGWPAGEPRLNEGFMPMVAQVFDSGFGGEVWDLYFADSPSTWFDEHRDLLFAGQYDRRQAGGPFFDWYRTLEPAQIARSWRQVLSIDSHIETDLNFWDCATLEFVVPSDEMAKGSLARSHVSVWDGG